MSDPQPPDEQLQSGLPRFLAVMLALGGSFWGVLLALLLSRDVSLSSILTFGPGYLVTLGYLIRAACTPSPGNRQLIWIASLLVQGSWLAWISWAMADGALGGKTLNEPALVVTWWVFATVASVVGLFTDRATPAERLATLDAAGNQ